MQYEGPTVYVYRGEALRLLGRLEEAAPDLARATRDKPQRLRPIHEFRLFRIEDAFHSGNPNSASILPVFPFSVR